jgi:hypothetical protein
VKSAGISTFRAIDVAIEGERERRDKGEWWSRRIESDHLRLAADLIEPPQPGIQAVSSVWGLLRDCRACRGKRTGDDYS